MKKSSAIWIFAGILFLIACTKTPIDPNGGGTNTSVAKIVGTMEVEFRVPGSFLGPNRVLRADLSIAKDAESLYKGHFLETANVYNSKLIYQFDLSPGVYYYQAGIICVAEGDSCTAAGFPAGRFGMKWAIGTVEVKQDATIHVIPQFTN